MLVVRRCCYLHRLKVGTMFSKPQLLFGRSHSMWLGAILHSKKHCCDSFTNLNFEIILYFSYYIILCNVNINVIKFRHLRWPYNAYLCLCCLSLV